MRPHSLITTLSWLTVLAAPSAGAVGGVQNTPWSYGTLDPDTWMGYSASTAGDVDGDGLSDIIVGAPRADGAGGVNQGLALVFLGADAGLPPAPAWTEENDIQNSGLGRTVSTAGDVNGDGYDDVALFVDNLDLVVVYHGSPAGPSATPDTELYGVENNEQFGGALSTAGDINGDGYDDLLVGAPGYDGSAEAQGRVLLFLGSASGLSTVAAWADSGGMFSTGLGTSVAAAGDVNADGYDDIVVGAPSWDAGGASNLSNGKAHCYAGNAGGSPTLLWSYEGGSGEYLGDHVAGAGDVNGDGYADILVGGRGHNGFRGRVNLHYGSAAGPDTSVSWWEAGPDPSDSMSPCATAGDVNGDGIADFMIGIPSTASIPGETRLYLGAKTGPSHTPVWTGADTDGFCVGTAGDVNGDGLSDILIGAPYTDFEDSTDTGRVHVYYGRAEDLPGFYPSEHMGPVAGAREGLAVSGAGDVNADGYDDVLVGAPEFDDGADHGGQVQLFYGSDDGPDYANPWVRHGTQVHERMGAAVSGAGDVNGDGYADFLVGDPAYDPPGSPPDTTGRVDLYYGSPSGPVGPVWTSTGSQDGESYGAAVSGAGDVNGDGYADILIGAPFFHDVSGDEGRAVLFLGSSAGPDAIPDWEAAGPAPGALFGWSLDGAGDMDADGFDEIAVGSPGFVNGFGTAGACYVFLGSASGPDAGPHLSVEGGAGDPRLGWSVSGGGDFDADGFADFVVGEPYYDGTGGADQGRVSLFLGGPLPLASAPAKSFQGPSAGSLGGWSVSVAGDAEADGYTDIVFGSPSYDGTGTDKGLASLLRGSFTGSGGVVWTAVGRTVLGRFGSSVSGAGDVNGDGYGDVIGGEPDAAGPIYYGGRVVVYHGNEVGVPVAEKTWPRGYGMERSSGWPLRRGGLVPGGSARLLAAGWSPGGRTGVALEWDLAPLGTLLPSPGLSLAAGGWQDSGPVQPSGLSSTPLEVLLAGLDTGTLYHCRFRVATRSPYFPHSRWLTLDDAPEQLAHFRTGTATVGVGSGDRAGSTLAASPNPFRSGTRIAFDNPVAGRVGLCVFDAAGRLVAAPQDAWQPGGPVHLVWDGRDRQGRPAQAGVYFLRLETAVAVRTVQVLKLAR